MEVKSMITAYISEKGQVTLPARARRKLGIKPHSKVELDIRNDEIIIRPVKSLSEVAGIFHKYAEGKSADWETVRSQTEQAVSKEIVNDK
jgi:AbrB family looped-hinge helix DNA binding protein